MSVDIGKYEVRVAVDCPVFDSFSYLSETPLEAGMRVKVPFGGRKLTGVALESEPFDSEVERTYKLRTISQVVDSGPIYSPTLLKLAQFLSDYYLHPLGEVLRTMLPGGAKITKKISYVYRPPSERKDHAKGFIESEYTPEDILAKIFKKKTSVTESTFKKNVLKFSDEFRKSGFDDAPSELVSALSRQGYVEKRTEKILSVKKTASARRPGDDFESSSFDTVESMGGTSDSDKETGKDGAGKQGTSLASEYLEKVKCREFELTAAQSYAFNQILENTSADAFKPVLFHGVTGAGKTEVYLQLIRTVLERGSQPTGFSQILVMVPEISLTPQMTRIFSERFPGLVAVVHSNMLESTRWAQLDLIRSGRASILIGPRSSVFAPFKNLALVIVDEEHDASYKQGSGLMYHGRDTAVVRAKLEGAGIVLGSATPSLETYYNAQTGRYCLVTLSERVGGKALPGIDVFRSEQQGKSATLMRRTPGNGPQESVDDVPVDQKILDALEENKKNGFQSMVIVNRRGHAFYLFDVSSREAVECPHCSISLTLHKRSTILKCHYCDYAQKVDDVLASAPSTQFVSVGYGSEKAAAYLAAKFPDFKIARVDSDVMQKRDELERVLSDFRDGSIDILVGTQMLAKGHDFAKVTLICLLEVDQLLNLPDMRAGERTFQLMVQAAGRAGRAHHPGKVLVQSPRQLHPVVKAGLGHDYSSFIDYEMQFRKLNDYPPFSKMVLIEYNCENKNHLEAATSSLESFIDSHIDAGEHALSHVKVLGPASPPIEIIRGRVRRTVLLVGRNHSSLKSAAISILENLNSHKGKVRIKVDVDPQTML